MAVFWQCFFGRDWNIYLPNPGWAPVGCRVWRSRNTGWAHAVASWLSVFPMRISTRGEEGGFESVHPSPSRISQKPKKLTYMIRFFEIAALEVDVQSKALLILDVAGGDSDQKWNTFLNQHLA
eukprot:scaffold614_cov378-Pavlova_lutheri.AAC.10